MDEFRDAKDDIFFWPCSWPISNTM